MMKLYLLLFVVILQLVNSNLVYPQRETCGYESCPATKEGMLNVHIVCHTHLDTGWTETYDDYYYRYVRMIYDSVVETLFGSSDRKFIVVETSFFSRWFKEQNQTIQNRVHWLVGKGQLEFISGGWSMNDEAAAHYSAIIDQLTLGMRWLNRTFGECGLTRIGWQIDPFGHSREQASIFAQMGFDGMFLGRIDYQDKLLRERTRTLEFIWKSSPSLGKKADLFTGVLPNVYWPPKGFCYDVNCFDEPISAGNAVRKAHEFIGIVKEQSKKYTTNHTIITMGMDFYYRDASRWYSNLDKLMSAVNAIQNEQKVNVIYSTPSCYLKSLNEANKTWPIKLDDFFPYADAWNAYWTGYFTSRPSLKYQIKVANNIVQSAKQLNVLARTDSKKILALQEALGILQHHDSVTGTCKQFVSDDYTRMLSKAFLKAEESITDSYYSLLQNEGFATISSLTFCNQLNISSCPLTERIDITSDGVVAIYNPLAHPVKHYVRLPVRDSGYRVKDAAGGLVQTQVVPINHRIISLPERNSTANCELVFQALLPPLGFSSFIVDKINNDYPTIIASQESRIRDGVSLTEDVTLDNGKISIKIDSQTGLLKEVALKNGKRIPLSQNFWYYQGEDRFRGEKPSGAYAFNPTHHVPHVSTNVVSYKIIRGNLVDEVHQTFKPWITQIIRLYRDYDYIEFDWIVGPIPIKNWLYDHGLEVISRFDSNFPNNGTFFTDSNGRETLRRIRHYRPTWPLETSEAVASNYYPVTSWVFIRDYTQDLQMTVLTDRTEGATSMTDGSLELMVHRRLLYDDGYGMEEALNEPGYDNNGLIVRGKHRLIINNIKESVRQMRTMTKTLTWKPIPLFRRSIVTNGRARLRSLSRSLNNINFVGINNLLPKNIHLLTLEQWEDNYILLRLEHFYEMNEDSQYSVPTDVSLRNLFTTFRIIQVKEMTLSANRELVIAERDRMKWMPDFDPYENYTSAYDRISVNENLTSNESLNITNPSFTFTLKPMQIRTFLLRAEPRLNCAYNGFNIPRKRQQRRYNSNSLDC